MNKNIKIRKLGYGASKLGKYLCHYSLSKKSFIYNLFKYHLPVIDTSPSYFFGFSERYINFLIKLYKKNDTKIFTKVGYPHNCFYKIYFYFGFFDRNIYFNDEKLFRKSVESSLSRLHNCKIDCLFLHSPNVYKINLNILKNEIIKLESNKKIESFGISLNSIEDLKFCVRNNFIPKYIQISAEDYLLNKNFYINICNSNNIYIVVNRIFSIYEIKNNNNFIKKLTMDENIKFILLGLTQYKYLKILNDY